MDIFLKLRELELKEDDDKFQGACFVHGGNNKTAFVLYKNTGIWRCWTKQCHETIDLYKYLNVTRGKTSDDYKFSFQGKFNPTPIMTTRSFLSKYMVPSPYFLQRGFDRETLEFFLIGACLNAQDYLHNRSIVPLFYNNQIVGYSARAHGDQQPKWIHSKGLQRSSYLYNIDNLKGGTAILVEGPADAWRVHEAGYPNVVAVLGSSLNQGQVNLLQQKSIEDIIILMDNDKAGHQATDAIYKKLNSLFNIHVPRLSGTDPGEMTPEQLAGELSID